MSVTGELHRKWSWPNLKQCSSSCLEQLRKAAKISSHGSRLTGKVTAQSGSYSRCNTSCYGHSHCQRGSIFQWGCMTSSGTLGCLPSELNQLKHESDHWPPYFLGVSRAGCVLGEKQQLVLSCRSASESKCPSSCTEWYWAILIHLKSHFLPCNYSS
jgi:hypothetical protein